MNQEGTQHEKPDGERWLELIGFGELKGQPTGYVIDGEPVLAEQFDKLCGDHARPIFVALESMDQNDPRFKQYKDVARRAFEGYFSVHDQKD